jgi:hypothetical protein
VKQLKQKKKTKQKLEKKKKVDSIWKRFCNTKEGGIEMSSWRSVHNKHTQWQVAYKV